MKSASAAASCKRCDLVFKSAEELSQHNFLIHLNGFTINTDIGTRRSFLRIDYGEFTCQTCSSGCGSFDEILLHLFCELPGGKPISNTKVIKRRGNREASGQEDGDEDDGDNFEFILTNYHQDGVNALALDIRNPEISHQVKARMLWESYYSEIQSGDFFANGWERWKRQNLNLAKCISFNKREISIEKAVEKVFDRTRFTTPAWNKKYLRAFEQWLIDFPNENHEKLLVNAALDMGIDHIRNHSGDNAFFSHGKIYVIIGEKRRIQADAIAISSKDQASEEIEVITKLDQMERAPQRVYSVRHPQKNTFTVEETSNLVRGINFIGMSKWMKILNCPGLKFKKTRSSVDLKDKARNIERYLQEIKLDGRCYWVLPGLLDECTRPISLSDLNAIRTYKPKKKQASAVSRWLLGDDASQSDSGHGSGSESSYYGSVGDPYYGSGYDST